MTTIKRTLVAGLSIALLSTLATAAGFSNEIKGRQSFMGVLGYNMGILGGMASEKIPYDAVLASAAAKNIALAAAMNNGSMWPQGSDMDNNEGTWAKADLWENFPAAAEQLKNLASASDILAVSAGNGLKSLQQDLKGVGDACKECHKRFRAKKE